MLSSHRYRIRPSNGNTLLVWLDLQKNIRSVSGPLIHFLNYKYDEFVGLDFSSLIVPNDRLSFESLFNPRVDRSEFGIYRPDSSVMFADALIFDLVDEDNQVSGHCLRLYDHSARMQQIDALLEQEKEFKKILDQINEVVCVFRNEKLVYANRTASRALGYKMEDFYGTNLSYLFETADYDSVTSFLENINHTVEEQFLPVSGMVNAAGNKVSCELKMQNIYYESYPALLLVAAINGEDSGNISDYISKQVNFGVSDSFDLDLLLQ